MHSSMVECFRQRPQYTDTGHVKYTLFAIILDFDFRSTNFWGGETFTGGGGGGGDPRAPLYLCMRPCSHLRFDFKCEYDPQ